MLSKIKDSDLNQGDLKWFYDYYSLKSWKFIKLDLNRNPKFDRVTWHPSIVLHLLGDKRTSLSHKTSAPYFGLSQHAGRHFGL